VTIYAHDPEQRQLLAVWPKGSGHHASRITEVTASADLADVAILCEELTELSTMMWQTYTDPPPDPDDDHDHSVMPLSQITAGLREPRLPDEKGSLVVSYDVLDEASHRTGRALLRINDATLTDAVVADLAREIDAVERAELGDLNGRAAQATSLDHLDTSPSQVAAANAVFARDPLGDDDLFISLDPASACVAAAHWLAAAAVTVGGTLKIPPSSIFVEANNIEPCSIEVPQLVVTAIDEDDAAPHEVVTSLLLGAARVRDGEIPDLDDLIQHVVEAQEQAETYPEDIREQAYAELLPTHLTPLDPRRPARDLLEHLLDGLQSANTLFHAEATFTDDGAPMIDNEVLPHPDGVPWPATQDHQAVHQALDIAFAARATEQAELTQNRLL
jgi:hypothetical protein